MIDLTTYVVMMLVLEITALVFIFRVMVRQFEIRRRPLVNVRIRAFRRILGAVSSTIAVMASVPIVINAYSLLSDTDRPMTVGVTSFAFALSLHLLVVLLAYLLWRIYSLANDDERKP